MREFRKPEKESAAGFIRRLIDEEAARSPVITTAHIHAIDAASVIAGRYPEECAKAMEDIGSWPSSETALRALQTVWR